MKRLSTEVLEALALDEALGVLCGGARRRYEKYVQCDEEAARARRIWRDCIGRLLGATPLRTPPPSVLAVLRSRLAEAGRQAADSPRPSDL